MWTCRAALSALAVAALVGGASASPRPEPVEHFTAKIVIALSPARFAFRTVDIVITQWSTDVEHRMLETALLEKGWVQFLDQLCTFVAVGSIVTLDGRDIAIRYAWQVVDRGGHRRVFVATDHADCVRESAGRSISVWPICSCSWNCTSARTVRAKGSCRRRRRSRLMRVTTSSSYATTRIGRCTW